MRSFLIHLAGWSAALVAAGAQPSVARAQGDDAPAAAPPAAAAPALGGPIAPLSEDVTVEPHRVRWDDDWPKFRTSEFVITGLSAALAFGSLAIPDGGGRWTSRNAFDEGARDRLRLSSKASREIARDLSDFFLVALSNQLVIDTVVVSWWHYGASEVAWQTTLITAEVIAVNVAINSTISGITARQRPYGDSCAGVPDEQLTDDCDGNRRYRSFYSGHTSTAFAAASVLCMNHMYLGLYGGGAADALACVTGYAAAGTVGAMRLVGDEHWASDVMVGAAAGTAVGLGLPYFLHYSGGALEEAKSGERGEHGVRWAIVPSVGGGTVMGTF